MLCSIEGVEKEKKPRSLLNKHGKERDKYGALALSFISLFLKSSILFTKENTA